MVEESSKRCYVCKETKLLDFFYNKKNSKYGKRYECKQCSDINSKSYAKKNWKDKIQPRTKGYRLKFKYGISEEDLDKMHEEQGGSCAICSTELLYNGNGFTGASIDHDHATGKVRGLLCGHCNGALGKFKDNVDTLQAAINYLRKHGNYLETTS